MSLYSEFVKVILCRNGTEERMQFGKKVEDMPKHNLSLRKNQTENLQNLS